MSLINTMEGGMDQISEMLIRQRELTIQSMNDTNTIEDKSLIQDEINQLINEIDSISERVQFNGINLLNTNDVKNSYMIKAHHSEINTYYIDVEEGDNFYLTFGDLTNTTDSDLTYVGIIAPNGDVFGCGTTGSLIDDTSYCTDTSSSTCDKAEYSGSSDISETLNFTNISSTGVGKWQIIVVNASDNDMNYNLSSNLEVKKTGYYGGGTEEEGLYIQAGANSNQGMYITRYDCGADSLGISNLPVTSYENASNTLDKIDSAIDTISSYRVSCGAQFNRLEYTQNSLQISSENLSDSNSRIEDADMAKEMMKLAKVNILENAGISILTQSNQMLSSNVLALLQA